MFDEHSFVLMRFDGVNLMFPRSDVLAVESLSNVRRDELHIPAVGMLELDDQEFPVYALSKKFNFMNNPQQNWRFCVCLETPNISDRFVLACDSVEQYILPNDKKTQKLPEFMRVLHSPIQGMLRVGNELALVCTAESMRTFVEIQEHPDD